MERDLRFAVRRMDDNGGEFEVTRTSSRAEAEVICTRMTRLGHKQIYWVVELRDTAPARPD